MKKVFNVWLLCTIMVFSFVSCSDDDDSSPVDGFNYPAEMLYGTWEIIEFNGMDWFQETTTATFKSDGTYYGRGYFGNGSGTYKAKGNFIKCYVEGKPYLKYEVLSLTKDRTKLKMYPGNENTSDVTIVCKKR